MNAKTTLFTLFAGLAILLAGCDNNDDDHKDAIEPTEPVMQAFNKKYPNASNPIFTIEGNYYVAEFTNNGVSTEAWLTEQGKWMIPIRSTGIVWQSFIRSMPKKGTVIWICITPRTAILSRL